MMRVMLYEAAQSMLRLKKWSWFKAWAMQIARRRRMKKAIVALAHRCGRGDRYPNTGWWFIRRNRPGAEQKCSSSKISFNHASYCAITAEPSVRTPYCPRAEVRPTPDMFLSQ